VSQIDGCFSKSASRQAGTRAGCRGVVEEVYIPCLRYRLRCRCGIGRVTDAEHWRCPRCGHPRKPGVPAREWIVRACSLRCSHRGLPCQLPGQAEEVPETAAGRVLQS